MSYDEATATKTEMRRRLEGIIEQAIVYHNSHDGDMGPRGLSIGIASVLVDDFGDELPGLLVRIQLEEEYEKGYRYGRRTANYPEADF